MANTFTAHTSAFTGDVNDFALETFVLGPYTVGTASGSVVLGTDGTYPLFTLPFKADIEKITVRDTTVAAAGADTIQFAVAAPGTAIGSASAITAAHDMNAPTVDTPWDVPFSGTGHLGLASGTTLALVTGGTIVSLAGLVITVVLRKTAQRTTDSSRKFYTKNS